MMSRNQAWASRIEKEQPELFASLKSGQQPKVLWIGCSDSRVPAEDIAGFGPGEVFVHRNVANMCIHTDMSFLSVLQFAVEVLKVEHIVVCGHTGCGGVRAATTPQDLGLIENWLRNIRDVARLHNSALEPLSGEAKLNRLIELNVIEQARNIFKSGVFQAARNRSNGTRPGLHGVIYDVGCGRLVPVPLNLAAFVKQTSHIYKLIKDAPTLAFEEDPDALLNDAWLNALRKMNAPGMLTSPSASAAAVAPGGMARPAGPTPAN